MLLMYVLGTVTALRWRRCSSARCCAARCVPMILEMPRVPAAQPAQSLLQNVWHRAQMFLRRAGTVILSCSVRALGTATYPKTTCSPTRCRRKRAHEIQLENSALGHIGKLIEPVGASAGV